VPAEFCAATWNVYVVFAFNPVTVTEFTSTPTDGPRVQGPLPILYRDRKPLSSLEASIHANVALESVVD
jgi:hypothetical protein